MPVPCLQPGCRKVVRNLDSLLQPFQHPGADRDRVGEPAGENGPADIDRLDDPQGDGIKAQYAAEPCLELGLGEWPREEEAQPHAHLGAAEVGPDWISSATC